MKRRPRSGAPLIGITPDIETARGARSGARPENLIVLQQRYASALLNAGGIPLILAPTHARGTIRQIADRLDGVVVSGGNFDIQPDLYGEEPQERLGNIKEERTRFELELISLALARNLPLLGVCGGAQAINVALGGSLYQDIASQIPGARGHELDELKDRGGHKIKIRDGTRLRRIVGHGELEVNTTHHQAVKRLGRGLIVSATAEDGVIEAIESRRHSFVLGLQWHPEFLSDRDALQRKLFTSFVLACRETRR